MNFYAQESTCNCVCLDGAFAPPRGVRIAGGGTDAPGGVINGSSVLLRTPTLLHAFSLFLVDTDRMCTETRRFSEVCTNLWIAKQWVSYV